MWIRKCSEPCCYAEMGLPVSKECRPPPDPDHTENSNPQPRPTCRKAGEQTPAALVWSRCGLDEILSPVSANTSQASLLPARTPDRDQDDEDPYQPRP